MVNERLEPMVNERLEPMARARGAESDPESL
jgi:hypothetical protein